MSDEDQTTDEQVDEAVDRSESREGDDDELEFPRQQMVGDDETALDRDASDADEEDGTDDPSGHPAQLRPGRRTDRSREEHREES